MPVGAYIVHNWFKLYKVSWSLPGLQRFNPLQVEVAIVTVPKTSVNKWAYSVEF